MPRKNKAIVIRILFYGISISALTYCALTIIRHMVTILSLGAWLISLLCASVATYNNESQTPKKSVWSHRFSLKDLIIVGFLIETSLAVLWYFGNLPFHFHQDEFITAYSSATLPSLFSIDWFSGYPEIWVARFPILFHVLQWPFFALFGTTVTIVRISIWPYHCGTLLFLYLLLLKAHTRRGAIIATTLAAFFAPTLYLFSMGLHFASSTFFFTGSLYFCWKVLSKPCRFDYLILGFFIGLCYLTYPSSYIAVPCLIILTLLHYLKSQSWDSLLLVGKSLLIAGIVLFPFLIHNLYGDPYFLERISQTNAFWGTWSSTAESIIHGLSIPSAFMSHSINAFRSLVSPHVGGIGGYWFGGLSLIDPVSAGFLFSGLILIAYQVVVRRNLLMSILFFSFLFAFFGNFILTTHPPAFQRLSVIYPVMAAVISWPLIVLYDYIRNTIVATIIVVLLLNILILLNIMHANRMIQNDSKTSTLSGIAVSQFLLETVPPQTIIPIAAYPSFYLKYELFFRTAGNFLFLQNTKETVSDSYNGKTPMIVFNPTEHILTSITRQFPSHGILKTLNSLSLKDIILIVPPRYNTLYNQ